MSLLDDIRAKVNAAKESATITHPVIEKFRAPKVNFRKIPPGESPVTVYFSNPKVRARFYTRMNEVLSSIVGDKPGPDIIVDKAPYSWACALNTLVRLDQRFGDDLRSQYLVGRKAHDVDKLVTENPWNEVEQYWQWVRWYGGWWWGYREKHDK